MNLNKFKSEVINFFYNIFYPIFFELVFIRDKYRIHNIYGKPKKLSKIQIKENQISFVIKGGKITECGRYNPEIVFMIKNLKNPINRVILDGDSKKVIPIIKDKIPNLNNSDFITVGLGSSKDFDFVWNFENPKPKNIPPADLIISQAMLEHLLMPFEHLRDLATLLNKDGRIILHTQLPGYSYHRYPIDSVRFYPDFFEEAAKRLNLEVIEKYQDSFHIYYHLKKR